MIPGSNILNQALSVIAQTQFLYYMANARTPNSVGQYQSTYNQPRMLTGSVQAVPRNLYEKYGLEFQNHYLKIYVSQNVIDVTRNSSGDMVVYSCSNWQIESITPWFAIDGWVEIIAVQVPNAPVVGT